MDSSVELLINKLLASISEYKASDLHLSAGNPPVLRIADKIMPLTSEDLLTPEFIKSVADNLLTEDQAKQLEVNRDVLFSHSFKGKERYKIHIYYQQGYLSISFRLIPLAIQPLTSTEFPDSVKNIAQYQDGLIIVSGPYGSGKTTFIASCIEYYNQNLEKHIVTYEQPIEILFTDSKSVVEQREIGRDAPNASSAKDFVSQEDVDILVLSDVHDADTIKAALGVAQMGKLVLIEMTANSVQMTLERIIDIIDSTDESHVRMALSSVLRAIVSLQGIPNNAGGLSIATELLLLSPGVVTMLRQDTFEKVNTIIENGQIEGMISLQQSINNLVQTGQISPRI